MNRRLLPYEYQLIEALGVSKEEYLEFVALQQEYKDPKVGTALDVRNELATVAIVLTVVGTLFQVGAALLAPKPKMPDIGSDNQRRTRQQRFSPSSGFNSAPELASYGDPVNLVYTNKDDNPAGGVRISGSLVWSSVDNYGSSQFMQLLFVLGAAEILNLSTKRTAFGSLSIDQLDPATTFLFYKSAAGGKSPSFDDLERGDLSFYPQDLLRGGRQTVCQVITIANPGGTAGFSQAYSPTTSSSLGVYDPIPVNVEMVTRDSEGEEQDALNGIELEQLDWTSTSFQYKEGREIIVRFQSKGYTGGGDDEAVPLAVNLRRQSVNALDFGSTYMLGSAKFRLISFGNSKDIDNGDVNARFRCVESGFCPTAPYNEVSPIREARDEKKKLEKHVKILQNKFDDDKEVPADLELPLFDDEGNELNAVQEQEVDRKVKEEYNKTKFANLKFQIGHCKLDYNFSDPRKVVWKDELDKKRTYLLDTEGSIEYTKVLQKAALDDPPTISTKALVEELEDDRKKARRLARRIRKGEYDQVHTWIHIPNKKDKNGNIKKSPFNNGLNNGASASLPMAIYSALEADRLVGDYTENSLKALNEKLDGLEGLVENAPMQINKDLKSDTHRSPPIKGTIAGESVFAAGAGNTGVRRFINSNKLVSNTKDGSFQPRASARRKNRNVARVKELIQTRTQEIMDEQRDWLIEQLEDYPGEHVDNSGRKITDPIFYSSLINNRFASGGISQIEDRIDGLSGKRKVVDPIGQQAIQRGFRSVLAKKQNSLERIQDVLKNWEDCIAAADNHFFVKALVKAESAAYETMSEVDQEVTTAYMDAKPSLGFPTRKGQTGVIQYIQCFFLCVRLQRAMRTTILISLLQAVTGMPLSSNLSMT